MDAYYQFNNGKAATADNGKRNVKFQWCRFIRSVVTLELRYA